jgi:hypothetical protein
LLKPLRTLSLATIPVLVGLVLPGPGMAASVTATALISGTTLSVATSSTPNFTANLDGGDATSSYSLALSTQDTRGTGAGWNETVTSTQFTTGAPSNYSLPVSASTVTGVSSLGGSGTSTAPSDALSYPIAVPSGPTAPAPVKFFDTAADGGMGRFTVSPTISVFVPQDSYAGTYTSTLTLAISSGP